MILQHAETSGRFNGESYVEFLTQLLAYYKGKIILIEDGAPYHGSGVIKEFKLANVDRLTVERLPAFSPAVSPGRADSLQKAQGNLPIRSAR
ncbi:transposase [Bathymodiolus japonicus methanotrophic gill symbiont]|uniref:transposase n=1 Tax=Bathymodiolus japonicus methanotrophic gill symbiont TaxID=113269 RepID=UPI003B834B95